MADITVPVVWTVEQSRVKTGLTRFTIMRLVKTGRVKFIRAGAGQRGKILINAASLCEYMEGGGQV